MSSNKENFCNNILIFGDSYSTFEGYIPEGYDVYYDRIGSRENDVTSVEDTWWYNFAKIINGNILLNNSWSGSTIGYTGWHGIDASTSSSFIYRFRKLKKDGFFEKNKIDTVLIFGATNDSWSDAPLGNEKFSDFKESDFYTVLPAISYFIKSVCDELPNARIIYIINDELKPQIKDTIKSASSLYGCEFVELPEIDKFTGHPTKSGMRSICELLVDFYKNSH